MIDAVRRYFEFEKHQATFRAEVIGGATTFMTMSYIVVVNPKVLEAAGIPIGASMTATILTAVIGTLMMGLYARRPFAVAPYMGETPSSPIRWWWSSAIRGRPRSGRSLSPEYCS